MSGFRLVRFPTTFSSALCLTTQLFSTTTSAFFAESADDRPI